MKKTTKTTKPLPYTVDLKKQKEEEYQQYLDSLPKLDLACGQNKVPGCVGVDHVKTKDTDIVCDLNKFPWKPLKTGAYGRIFCNHYFEHIPGPDRFKFMDEIYRILATGGSLHIVCPYYSSMRAVQDPTHTWPPVCEASFLYFNKGWREQNKLDHYPVSCDFDFHFGYIPTEETAARHNDSGGDNAQQFWVKHYINAVNDIQVMLVKR